jgi:hypothetical protein
MYRYKTLTSGTLSLHCFEGQINEALPNVKILKKVNSLDIPKKGDSIIYCYWR